MNKGEKVEFLIDILERQPIPYDFSQIKGNRRLYLRALMNITMPYDLPDEYYEAEKELLEEETKERETFTLDDTLASPLNDNLLLFFGDITTLTTDAIVNAANSDLLGCFHPLHNCIDNIIGSRAGLALRKELMAIMEIQGQAEETGRAKITKAYALPSKFIIHTVGPIVPTHKPTKEDASLLRSCYTSSINLALEKGLKSIAFPAISTGVFGYPKEAAAKEAVKAALEVKEDIKIVFVAYEEKDLMIYKKELKIDV